MDRPNAESAPAKSDIQSDGAAKRVDAADQEAACEKKLSAKVAEHAGAVSKTDDNGCVVAVVDNPCPAGAFGNARDVKLHLATLWLPCLEMVCGIIFPALVASLFVPFGTVVFVVSCFAVLPAALLNILRYITFRYQVFDRELVVSSGLLFQNERRIPFDRVQEIGIHQTVVHRLFDLARLEITTAGSHAQEANLNVISMRCAEVIKSAVNSQNDKSSCDLDVLSSTGNDVDFRYRVNLRDLIVGGLTSRLVASLGAIVTVLIYFYVFVGFGDAWFHNVEQDIDRSVGQQLPGRSGFDALTDHFQSWLPDLGPLNFVVEFYFDDTLLKSLTLVLLGLGVSIVAYVIRYHGFQLIRRGDVLGTTYGFFTRHVGSLPRDRIQTLKLEEGLLRRYFGMASIRVDSAGDRKQIDEAKKREVLVPVAAKSMADAIVKEAIPGLSGLEPEWRRVSPKAILRGAKKGWLLLLIAGLQTYGIAGWYCLFWLPGVPIVYLLNYQWFRHAGYWMEDFYFLYRKGWLNRETVYLPMKSIQNVSVTQSFFDRRRGLATLLVDTAGHSNTGGGPKIRHMPVCEAMNVQRETIRRAAESVSDW